MYLDKPVIALTSSYMCNEQTEKVFLPNNYLDAIRHFGAIPVLIPTKASQEEIELLLGQCDGLLLTGGNDITPSLYGEEIWNDSVEPAPERDDMEMRLCAIAVGRQMPMLGICRGIQLMNVCFGGTLYQDLPTQYDSEVNHRMEPPDHRTCHDCVLDTGSPIYSAVGLQNIQVNSHHHQAIKDPAPCFAIAGRCSDGVIEAVWRPDLRFCWAVQWHPEKIWDIEPSSAKIFEAFINACKQ